MKDRDVRVINCPRNIRVEPLKKGKFLGIVPRYCSKIAESSSLFMVGNLAFCKKDCPEKKLIDKKLPIVNCPIEGVTFPITVNKGIFVTGTEEHFLCVQPNDFVRITFNSLPTGNGLAVCSNSDSCEIQQIREGKGPQRIL